MSARVSASMAVRRSLRAGESHTVCSNGVFPPSDEAGENGRRRHRVGVALLAVAGVLVGLHLTGEVAAVIHADGRGHRI
jgi:hypothetical protein